MMRQSAELRFASYPLEVDVVSMEPWALCFQRINQFEYPQTPTAASGEHAQIAKYAGC